MKARLDERVLFGLGDRVRIARPAKGHAHMQGWEGRVTAVHSGLLRRDPVDYVVRFMGGSTVFVGSELEIVSAAAPAFEIAEGRDS